MSGEIVSWNAAAERIFGYSAEEIVGRSIRTLIPQDRQEEEDRILANISRGDHVPTFETVRLCKDGSEVFVAVTVSPVCDASGNVVGASKIARDISERLEVRARLEESEQRFRLLADNMSQLAWIADKNGWIFWYNRRWFDYTGTTLEDMQGWGWKAVHHPDHVDRVVEKIQHSWDTGEVWEDTFPLRSADGEYRWFLSRAEPIRDEDGEVTCWFGTNTDVTEMRDAEKRIELLLQEVNHRSKNMLAIIQSLARRTASRGEDFVERLEQRIRALAANQDVLVDRSWSDIPVREMVEAQLWFLDDVAGGQIELEGSEVRLSPGAAEALAMAIHEMATNAVKYGALASAAGRVQIAWHIEGHGDDLQFVMSWIESGGPQVVAPTDHGFGSRIISEVPKTRLQGDVDVSFEEGGFRWCLRCPAENILR